MTGSQLRWVALVATVSMTACGGATGSARTAPRPPATSVRVEVSDVAQARPDSTRYPYTEADVRFMQHMIGHHAQAIAMADLAPTHDASAAIRRLAERIINAQQDEIRTMQQWLRERRLPVPEARPAGMTVTHGGVEHEMLMPGMLTPAQMKQLDEARGKAFDRLFLTFMIQHHQGAVSMVKDLFGSYGAGLDETVFKFASDVNVDQSTEIERMQTMLIALLIDTRSP
jgi:uncharacterized protein (DUF305 family)